MLTYKQQFDKLTEAYIKDQVQPYSGCACFIGNLLDKDSEWMNCRLGYGFAKEDYNTVVGFADLGEWKGYTSIEIVEMEKLFLGIMYKEYWRGKRDWENVLFEAFEKTLDLLKEIHISKGEVIEETPNFSKRNLQLQS